MGFGDWLSDAVDTVVDAGESVIGAGEKVIKPIVKPVKKVGGKVIDVGEDVLNKAGDVANTQLGFLERTENSLVGATEFLSSPLGMIGLFIVAVIVLPKVLK